MVVSIEWFVLQNLSMDALILVLAARLAGVRVGWARVAGGALLGCGYAVCAYLPWGRGLLGLLPRTAACAGMTLVLCMGWHVSNWRRTLRAFGFVWLSTLLMGGTGAGVTVSPVAFLMVSGDQVRLLPAVNSTPIDRLVEMIPQIVKDVKDLLPEKHGVTEIHI